MPISFGQVPALFEAIAAKAEAAAGPVALAMAEAAADHISHVTLRRYPHSPYTRTSAPHGGPPGDISGHLARSMFAMPGPSSGGVGVAYAGNTAIYAAVQQWGAEIWARDRKSLMWKTDYPTSVTNFLKSLREGNGLFLNFARRVDIPARDYMIRGTEEAIPWIEQKKIEVFMALVWGE